MACVRAACTSANMSRYMAPITATGRKKQKTNTASMYVNDATSPRCHAKEHHVPEMRQQQMETAAIGINVNKYQIGLERLLPHHVARMLRCRDECTEFQDVHWTICKEQPLEHVQHTRTSHCGVADERQTTEH